MRDSGSWLTQRVPRSRFSSPFHPFTSSPLHLVRLPRPEPLPFALDDIASLVQMAYNLLAMGLVAHLQHHLDPDPIDWDEPDGAAVEDVDHVGAGLGHVINQRRKVARPIVHRGPEQDIAALFDQHL